MSMSDAEGLRSGAEERLLLLLLSVPRALEERVTDWLLARDDVATFTSTPIYVHGVDPAVLLGAERVSARQRRTEFRVRIPASHLAQMTADLAIALPSADVSWVAVPVEANS